MPKIVYSPISASHIVEKIKDIAVVCNQPVMLWGAMGIGKSDIMREVALTLAGIDKLSWGEYLTIGKRERYSYSKKTKQSNGVFADEKMKTNVEKYGNVGLIDLRLCLLGDASDIKGIPYVTSDNRMAWGEPTELPNQEVADKFDYIILFLDELASCHPQIQTAAFSLILDRRVGNYELPSNVRIVAAGNRADDGAHTFSMVAPLSNRLVHFELKADFNSWKNWALRNDINIDIFAFLANNQDKLFHYDASNKSQTGYMDRGFPTPRSWAMLSTALNAHPKWEDDENLFTIIQSYVGTSAASAFGAYMRIAHKLPDVEDVANGTAARLKSKSAEFQKVRFAIYYTLFLGCNKHLVNQSQNITTETEFAAFKTKMSNTIKYYKNNIEREFLIVAMQGLLYGKFADYDAKSPDTYYHRIWAEVDEFRDYIKENNKDMSEALVATI